MTNGVKQWLARPIQNIFYGKKFFVYIFIEIRIFDEPAVSNKSQYSEIPFPPNGLVIGLLQQYCCGNIHHFVNIYDKSKTTILPIGFDKT